MTYTFSAKFYYVPIKKNGIVVEDRFTLEYDGRVIPLNQNGVWIMGHTGNFEEICQLYNKDLEKLAGGKDKIQIKFEENFPVKERNMLEKLAENARS